VLDPRLSGDGLRTLTDLLARALPHDDEVEAVLTRSPITPSKVRSAKTVRHHWQNVLLAADARYPEKLDALLKEIEHELADMPVHLEALRSWTAVARRRAQPASALAEILDRSVQLGDQPDPRDAVHVARALRNGVLDLRDAFEDDVTAASLLGVDADAADVGREEIRSRCRRALSAIDTLLAGIEICRRLLEDRRPSDGEDVIFTKERNMVRILVDDRNDVVEAISRLKSVLTVRAPVLLPLRTHRDRG
jgi:hypothetical protein